MPSEPRKFKVEVVNSSSVLVQWRAPPDHHPSPVSQSASSTSASASSPRHHHQSSNTGIVRGYRVHYVAINEHGSPVELPSVVDVPGGSSTETTINGLLADTEYQLEMTAYTRRGDGQRTRPIKIRTRGAGLTVLHFWHLQFWNCLHKVQMSAN